MVRDPASAAAAVRWFGHDAFFGARWALIDTAETLVPGGPIVDDQTGETVAFDFLTLRVSRYF